MEIVEATEAAISRAAERLRAGAVVVLPTETVYGLAADATNARAIASIFATKRRPRFNPLIVHVPDAASASRLAVFHAPAQRLAEAFWPGALTLVLPKSDACQIADLVTAGLGTIALRAPLHPVPQAVLREVGVPLAAPSANRSGRVSPTTAQHVAQDFAREEGLILDGGPCLLGLESTIVGWNGDRPVLLRPGAIARGDIESVLDCEFDEAQASGAVTAPGQLASHYAPRARLRLNASALRDGEAFLGFGPGVSNATLNLSPSGDLLEAASNLFAALRSLDAADAEAIAVAPIPEHGLGEAINNRLRRAAAPRD